MSTTDTPNHGEQAPAEGLTDEERAVFERLVDRYPDDEELRHICETVLQSSDSEEAN